MAKNSDKAPRTRGRPTRQQELARALAQLGCDPALIDPKRILAALAADPEQPGAVRVAACRTLLKLGTETADHTDGLDELTRRAIQMGRVHDA